MESNPHNLETPFGTVRVTIHPEDPLVVVLECPSVESFLHELSPAGYVQERYTILDSPFVFRGVGSRSHHLVPSALRGPSKNLSGYAMAGTDLEDHLGQILFEQHLLRLFFHLSDRSSLPIPEDSQALRKLVDRLGDPAYGDSIIDGESPWPPDELLSVLGTAQHFGLPTRLLDWSWNSNVAAYFAATEGNRARKEGRSDQKDSIGVWSLNVSAARRILSSENLQLVTNPASLNERLHAQDGLFTLYRESLIDVERPVHGIPLNQYLINDIPDDRPGLRQLELFYLFLLPVGLAERALSSLARQRVTTARIYPGYEGVVRQINEGRTSIMGDQSQILFRTLRQL